MHTASCSWLFVALLALTPTGALTATQPELTPSAHEEEAPSTPEETITRLNEGLLHIMRNAEALAFAGRRDAIAPILAETFDFGTLAAGSVGRAIWTQWSPEARQRYREAFTAYTIANYAGRFDGFSGETFTLQGRQPGPAGTILLKTELTRPSDAPVPIDYLMRQHEGRWRVIDVFLEGTISELARQRSEFGSILASRGYDGLLAALEEKADALAIEPGVPGQSARP